MVTIDDWIKENPIPCPPGYSYEELKDQDKEFVRGMVFVLMEIENYAPDVFAEDGTLEKIKAEIAEKTVEELANNVMSAIADTIVSIMENDEDYWEKDPDECESCSLAFLYEGNDDSN